MSITAADAARAEPPRIQMRSEGGPPEVPESGLSFWDLLDVVNPLQHIPVVNTIYRAVTGDEIGTPARIAGGTLYGGVVGLVASVASAAIREETGRDPGEHVMALFDGEPASGTMLAEATFPAPAPAPAPAEPPSPLDVPAPAPAAVPGEAAAASLVADAGGQRAFTVPPRITEPTGRFFPVPARPMTAPAPAAGAVAEPPAEEEVVPATGAQAAQEWPPGGPPALPPEFVADAMMMALDKYQRTARLPGPGRTMPAAGGRI